MVQQRPTATWPLLACLERLGLAGSGSVALPPLLGKAGVGGRAGGQVGGRGKTENTERPPPPKATALPQPVPQAFGQGIHLLTYSLTCLLLSPRRPPSTTPRAWTWS